MATVNSIQAQAIADFASQIYGPLKPNQHYGRVRIAWFDYKSAASGPAVGDIIRLTKLPKGAKVIDYKIVTEAMSSGAGTAGADIGDDGDADRYEAARSFDAAATITPTSRIENTGDAVPAIGLGHELTTERWFQLTVTGEAFAASKQLRGYVAFVVD